MFFAYSSGSLDEVVDIWEEIYRLANNAISVDLSQLYYGVGLGSVLSFLIYDRKTPPHSHNFRISQVYDDIIEHGFRIA